MYVEKFKGPHSVLYSLKQKLNSLVSLATLVSSSILILYRKTGFWPSSKMSLKMDL